MNKITVSTLCWQRPEVFDAFCRNMITLDPAPRVVIAGSPYDGCEEIAKKYGLDYISTQNKLLGLKANMSAQLAMNDDSDYVMLTGSDDLISQKMWEYYCNFKGEVLGLKDYLFYNVKDERLIHWMGYANGVRDGWPIGANKLISKDVMKALNWSPFDSTKRHPDEGYTDRKLIKMGVSMEVVTMEETGGLSVDIKTGSNITRFQLWNNSKYINYSESIGKDKYLSDLVRSIPKIGWPVPKKPRR